LLLLAAGAFVFLRPKSDVSLAVRRFVTRLTPPPTLPDMPLARGRLKDRYQLGPRIGAGGMGEVFSGVDTSLNRKVAFKKMLPQLAGDQRERARFIAEARTVAALHHANIVDIFAIEEDGSDLYLVFEFVTGKTLQRIIKERGRIAFPEALPLVRSVSSALTFAHAKGVVHRDLKPANVMIADDGGVKVMDFGLAQTVKDASARLQMSGSIVGTPAYMAPEQAQGRFSQQSDVYALAVTLYELLSGRLPFDGQNLAAKLSGEIPPLNVPHLPSGVDETLAKAMSPDYRMRPANAKDFFRALEALSPLTRG
jgi:serine/threonine-protein kinase